MGRQAIRGSATASKNVKAEQSRDVVGTRQEAAFHGTLSIAIGDNGMTTIRRTRNK